MASTPGPIAKISRPYLSDVLPRRRLTDALDRAGNQPLVWISGPAGSGKTTLAAGYLDERSTPSIWYQMDRSDADPAAFFYFMGLAAGNLNPARPVDLPLLTPEYLPGLDTFARRFFEDLYAQVPAPFAIVLDDYHEIGAASPLHEVLKTSLSLAPPRVRTFVLSRRGPPPAFARLRANHRLCALGWEDLRFTLEESRLFIGRSAGTSEGLAQSLHARTEGWAAGLVLLTETGGGYSDTEEPDAQVSPEVFDYFAGEVLDQLDAETCEVLLAASLLPAVTVRSAQELAGGSRAGEILSRLHRDHFFTERILGPVATYRFHPLFRDFLLARLVETCSRERLADLREKAAEALLGEGQVEEAILQRCLAGNWLGATRLICEQAGSFLRQGRNRSLQEWIERIPAEVRAQTPWLLFWSGACVAATQPATARRFFEDALRLFGRGEDAAGSLLTWSAIVQTYLLEFDDFSPLDRWAGWLEGFLGQGGTLEDPRIEGHVVAGMMGVLAWRSPELPDREAWLERALALPQKRVDLDVCVRAYTNSALFLVWMGDFARCNLVIREMRAMLEAHTQTPLRSIIVKIAEAMLYNSMADLRGEAMRSVQDGLAIARESGVQLMSPMLCVQGAVAALNGGDLEVVDGYLRDMERTVTGERRINLGHHCFIAAWRNLLGGEVQQGVAFARRSLQLIAAAGAPFSETLVRLVLALGLEEAGDRGQARLELEAASRLARRTGSAYAGYLCSLTEADWALRQGQQEAGRAALGKALETGRRNDFGTLVYFWRPAVLSRLCGEALAAGIEVEYARRLIAKLALKPEGAYRHSEFWPRRLEVTTLGGFSLRKDGEPIGMAGKSPKKPLLLLKALVVAGPKGAHKAFLVDALWPDSEGDTGNIAFHTTVSRLRRLVGEESAILLRDGVLALDASAWWVDAWAFEALADEIEGNGARGLPGGAGYADAQKAGIEQALRLYSGGFLPADRDYGPALAMGDRLRDKYRRLLTRLGRLLAAEGAHADALDHYFRALDAHPFEEEFHRGLISCYLDLGRAAEAAGAYDRLCRVLQDELGVAPSEETERLKTRLAPGPGRG